MVRPRTLDIGSCPQLALGGAKDSTLLIRPLRAAGRSLALNAAVRQGGEIRVEVQAPGGPRLSVRR